MSNIRECVAERHELEVRMASLADSRRRLATEARFDAEAQRDLREVDEEIGTLRGRLRALDRSPRGAA